jgi:hypothetical protein
MWGVFLLFSRLGSVLRVQVAAPTAGVLYEDNGTTALLADDGVTTLLED